MRTSYRSFLTAIVATVALVGSTVVGTASGPDSATKTKATYERADLIRNLGRSMVISAQSKERITFKVDIDEEGDVTRLTYSHNVTSQSAQTVNTYIRNAYNAIMATEFTPAMLDGEPVKDTIQIEFDIAG